MGTRAPRHSPSLSELTGDDRRCINIAKVTMNEKLEYDVGTYMKLEVAQAACLLPDVKPECPVYLNPFVKYR